MTLGEDSTLSTLIKKFKLPDKRSTLDSFAKFLGMIVDKVNLGIKNYGDMSDKEIFDMLGMLRKKNES